MNVIELLASEVTGTSLLHSCGGDGPASGSSALEEVGVDGGDEDDEPSGLNVSGLRLLFASGEDGGVVCEPERVIRRNLCGSLGSVRPLSPRKSKLKYSSTTLKRFILRQLSSWQGPGMTGRASTRLNMAEFMISVASNSKPCSGAGDRKNAAQQRQHGSASPLFAWSWRSREKGVSSQGWKKRFGVSTRCLAVTPMRSPLKESS